MKYTEIIDAKNGSKIPLIEKIALHSKYNPEKEAETFASQFSEGRFFIILGLAGGYHISAMLKKFQNAKFIIYEEDEKSIEFLMNIPEVQNLKKSKQVIFSTSKTLEKEILTNYKPALQGNLIIATLRAWENAFQTEKNLIIEKINKTLKIISADFSVQKHFGLIWQKNILENLKISSQVNFDAKKAIENIPTNKIAAIIAAGPSFDKTYKILKENRENYFIIATDTAFSTLSERNIKTDAVISVDGQLVSHTHYMHKITKDTIFIFDFCANSSTVKKISKLNKNIIFANTGHPLSQYASNYTGEKSFINLETGSGTVTIAGVSFATLAGFSQIHIFGADFSYQNGKAYTKGTYLDKLYRINEDKLDNSETRFDKLMFRTELNMISEKIYSTPVLESYSSSLEEFMKRNKFEKKNSDKKIKIYQNSSMPKRKINLTSFNFKDFLKIYTTNLEKLINNGEINEISLEMMTILPLTAHLNSSILAITKTLEYTKTL